MSRDITCDSENFTHIFGRKQKSQLSEVKSAILQLNTRYYRNCYRENADKTQCDGPCLGNLQIYLHSYFWEECDYHICYATLEMYIPALHAKAHQHFGVWT